MRAGSILVVLLIAAGGTRAQTVTSVRFHTAATTMPTVVVRAELEPVRALIARGAGHVSEGSLLVAGITLGQQWFRLTPPQVAQLTRGFRDAYAQIEADPAMKGLPSVLGDAISQEPHRDGHYFLYRPAAVDAKTPVIIFLHGFGGNFQYYTWMMKQSFADAVVIAPSYGIAWSREGRGYFDEVLADAGRRLGVSIRRPWLVALSAGGPAGFDFYDRSPERFRGLICLASCPQPDQIATIKPGLKILMINGVRDDRFPIATVRQTIAPLHPQTVELEDADHFFLLTDRERTIRLMKNFLDR